MLIFTEGGNGWKAVCNTAVLIIQNATLIDCLHPKPQQNNSSKTVAAMVVYWNNSNQPQTIKISICMLEINSTVHIRAPSWFTIPPHCPAQLATDEWLLSS